MFTLLSRGISVLYTLNYPQSTRTLSGTSCSVKRDGRDRRLLIKPGRVDTSAVSPTHSPFLTLRYGSSYDLGSK